MQSNQVSSSNSLSSPLAIVYHAANSLRGHGSNARQHSKKQIKQIARSIETFGFNVPILVDASLTVLAGHGRLLAAQVLGLSSVPTIQLEHLSEAQARAFMITDNRLTEISVWDDRVLAMELAELTALDLDFSLDITGFEIGEIDFRIESLGDTLPDDKADQIPAAHGQIAVSRPGDLWKLGTHRLVCGSALQVEAYEVLMDGQKAAMVFTDPPYNVPIAGNVGGLGKIQHREFAMASGEMSADEFTQFLATSCQKMQAHSNDGALYMLCMDWRHVGELLAAGSGYSELKNICVWAKTNAGMGSLYRSQHEFVFVFKHGNAAHRNNIELGRHGRHRTNLWSYPSPTAFGRTGDEGNLLALHPTVKPVALVADAIMDCTDRREIVLDPFLGSGTTIIAAERVGRRCFGLELDPLYVDTIVRRWEAYTGVAAVSDLDGRPFAAIAADRTGSHV